MVSELDKVYSQAWYAEHREYASDYAYAAEALDWMFGPAKMLGEQLTVVDVGCGIGMILAGLSHYGWNAIGYEPSFNARMSASLMLTEAAMPRIHYADVRIDQDPSDQLADLVVCLEVAEHIDEAHAANLVATLQNTVAPGGAIVFTAAPPGQPGHEHVNCQPKSYWVALFKDHGCELDERRTQVLRDALDLACPKMRWIPENVMVFQEVA